MYTYMPPLCLQRIETAYIHYDNIPLQSESGWHPFLSLENPADKDSELSINCSITVEELCSVVFFPSGLRLNCIETPVQKNIIIFNQIVKLGSQTQRTFIRMQLS